MEKILKHKIGREGGREVEEASGRGEEDKGIDPFKKSGLKRTPPNQAIASTSIEADGSTELMGEIEGSKRKRGKSSDTSPAALGKKPKNPTWEIKLEEALGLGMQEVEIGEEASEAEVQTGDESWIEEPPITISSDEEGGEKEIKAKTTGKERRVRRKSVNIDNMEKLSRLLKKLQDKVHKSPKTELSHIMQEMGRQMSKVKEEWEKINEEKRAQEKKYEEAIARIETRTNDRSARATCEEKGTQTTGSKITEIKTSNNIEEFKMIAECFWGEECYQKTQLSEQDIESAPFDTAIIREEKSRGKTQEGILAQKFGKEGELGTVLHITNKIELETQEGNKEFKRHTYVLRTRNSQEKRIEEEDVFKCFMELKKKLKEQDIQKIAMSKIGGGGSNIAWGTIRKMLEYIYQDTNIEITIHGMRKPKKKDDIGEEEKGEKTSWAKVVGRRNKETGKKQEGKKYTDPRIKKKEAVLITTKNEEYAGVLKQIKEKINPKEAGIKIKAIRKTRGGNILIEAGGKEDTKKLKRTIEDTNIVEKVRILNEENKLQTMVITNIEEETTKKEIEEAIREVVDKEASENLEIKALRTAYDNTLTAIITITNKGLKQILEKENGSITIGWIACKARKWVNIKQCYKCFEYDHVAAECKGADHRGACNNCGNEGHKAAECKQQARCLTCKTDGHRTGTAKCPRHRRALEEARRYRK